MKKIGLDRYRISRLGILFGYALVCLCLQMVIDRSVYAADLTLEEMNVVGRLRRIQNEWVFVQDRLNLVEHDLGNDSKGQPVVGVREYCLDTGGVFYILTGAIGTTNAHDAYAADAKVIELLSNLRRNVVQLTSPCWQTDSSWPRKKMRAILAALKSDREELLARLKEL